MKKTLNNTESSNSTKPVLNAVFITSYLPYGVKIYEQRYSIKYDLVGICEDQIFAKDNLGEIFSFVPQYGIDKLILYPLSSLKENILVNEIEMDPIANLQLQGYNMNFDDEYTLEDFINENFLNNSYGFIELLLRWHFDVFGLIEKGLAISKHDVK
jgi:hypothetical protein